MTLSRCKASPVCPNCRKLANPTERHVIRPKALNPKQNPKPLVFEGLGFKTRDNDRGKTHSLSHMRPSCSVNF